MGCAAVCAIRCVQYAPFGVRQYAPWGVRQYAPFGVYSMRHWVCGSMRHEVRGSMRHSVCAVCAIRCAAVCAMGCAVVFAIGCVQYAPFGVCSMRHWVIIPLIRIVTKDSGLVGVPLQQLHLPSHSFVVRLVKKGLVERVLDNTST